jgi:2-aminoethylphosphonate-pyruvate transaminase
MKARGFILYPGKLTVVDSFPHRLHRPDGCQVMRAVVDAVGAVLAEMGVQSAAPPEAARAARAQLAG